MPKKPIEPEVISDANLTPKNREVLEVGKRQLAHYDETLRELADGITTKMDNDDDA
jgi:hypothetical protein